MREELLTYEWLRSRGFRFDSGHVDDQPHMVLVFDHQSDRALEMTAHARTGEWIVWLRSDIAHSRCRYIFVRRAIWGSQIEKLYAALTDNNLLMEVSYDKQQFAVSLASEIEDCKRRRDEYIRNERYSRIPG